MCEIAVVDPDRTGAEIIHQVAAKFNDEQGDGLGVLCVKNRGDKFEYSAYKSVEPHWQTLYSFLSRNLDDTWRVVIHGRAATAGTVKRQNAHPIRVDCDKCEWDWVVHNGSVRKHQQVRGGLTTAGHNFNTKVDCDKCEWDWVVHNGSVRKHQQVRGGLTTAGHNFNTKVDSEILAHNEESLPDSIEEKSINDYTINGNLHFLLFSEDGILTRSGSKYDVTDDFLMTCSRVTMDRNSGKDIDFGWEYSKNEWLLATPSKDGPDIETKERESRTHSGRYEKGNSNSQSQSHAGRTRGSTVQNYSGSGAGSEDDDKYTIEYIDHSSWENVIALQVAPGVMKVIEKGSNDVEYVYRDRNPRLYYWYAPEEEPDNLSELKRLADKYGRVPPESALDENQTTIEDFPRQRVMDAVSDEVMVTIQEEFLDSENVDEVVEMQSEINDAVAVATDAAIQAAQVNNA